jgi:hypothetical protein
MCFVEVVLLVSPKYNPCIHLADSELVGSSHHLGGGSLTVLHARAHGYDALVSQKETYCENENWKGYCASPFIFTDDYDAVAP